VLAAVYDYPTASAIAKHAAEHGLSIRDASIACGLMSEAEVDLLFGDILVFTDPERAERLIARFRAGRRIRPA
jgi:aspartate ammonia-lyase